MNEPNDIISQAIDTNLISSNLEISLSSQIGNNTNVEPTDDVDIYEFQLQAGEEVTIDIDARIFGSPLDPILRLFDSDGNELAVSDDDPAPGEPFTFDSFIDFTAGASDTYYVGVSSFANFDYDPFIEGSGVGDGFSTGTYDINFALDINGGFETGDFTAWGTIGDTSIETAEFGVIPTQGDFQALLTTGFGSVNDTELEDFLGLNSGDIDSIGNGDATEGSALEKTITVEAGDVLSFDFNFLTNEGTPTFFNDFAFVSITPNSLSELADTNSLFELSPTEFNEETDYDNFTFEFSEAGTYKVGIGVVDLIDTIVDSGLLVDNLKVISADKAILGTDNSESLFGEVGDDTIFGKEGNDQIFGSEGVNKLYGGAGNDTIFGGSQADSIFGGPGNDTIFASEGNNIVFGGLGDDTINTGSGNDKILAGFGNDTIFLGGGEDIVVLESGKGIDTINNFQLGQTSLDVSGNPNDLSIVDGASGAEISQFGELLAVVSSTSASTLIDNIDTVFI